MVVSEPVETLTEEHLRYLAESDDYSRRTVVNARPWLENFQAFCGHRSPTELKAKDLEKWHKTLAWTPGPSGNLYSQASVNQAVGAVRRFYRWLLAEGHVRANPTSTLVTPATKRNGSQRFELEGAEKRAVLAALDPDSPYGVRDRAVLGVLLETGISRPACSRINRDHLCFDTGALMTTGRSRKIHSLTEGLLADLHRYLQQARPLLVNDITPALFLDRYGNRLSPGSIQQITNKARSLANLT